MAEIEEGTQYCPSALRFRASEEKVKTVITFLMQRRNADPNTRIVGIQQNPQSVFCLVFPAATDWNEVPD